MKFSVLISKESKWYIARCPDINVTSQGKTIEEARTNLIEAVELYIESFGTKDLHKSKEAPFLTTIEVSAHA